MRWYTSDQHYGHVRISELAGRPFPHGDGPDAVGLMNLELLCRFNEAVDHDDEAWHLGDFAMGEIARTLPAVRLLAGTRQFLVAGNHDRCFPGFRHRNPDDYLAWAKKYTDAKFKEVWNYFHIMPVHVIAGQGVTLCHFPYRGGGDSRDHERYAKYRPEDQGGWLLHGHVHQKWRQKGKMINVGVDAWGGRPVSEEQIAELIEAGPNDLRPLPW